MNVAWLSLWEKHDLKMPDKPDSNNNFGSDYMILLWGQAPTLLEYVQSRAIRANAILDGGLDKTLDVLGADIMYRGAQRLAVKAIVAGAVVIVVSKSLQKTAPPKKKKEKREEDDQI